MCKKCALISNTLSRTVESALLIRKVASGSGLAKLPLGPDAVSYSTYNNN